MNIKNTDIAEHLKLPPVKLHCSMLAEDAIKAAVSDYKKKRVVDKKELWESLSPIIYCDILIGLFEIYLNYN